jgi:hypothetical protein
MTTRRLAVYLLIDIALWALALWLLCGDPVHTRLSFWYHARQTSARGAELLGRCALECEARYYAVVRNVS